MSCVWNPFVKPTLLHAADMHSHKNAKFCQNPHAVCKQVYDVNRMCTQKEKGGGASSSLLRTFVGHTGVRLGAP